MQAWLAAVAIFLYAPLIALMAFSFNDSRRNIVWKGFTLKYYDKAFHNDGLIEAFGNSLTIAAVSTVVSVASAPWSPWPCGGSASRARRSLDGALALPIVVPEICMGVAMLVFFAKVMPWPQGMPWPLNLGAIIISHVSFSFPFVAVVVRARMTSFNREMEEAARDLGAGEWRTIKDVILPHMAPSLVAGALLAFTLSLDDFVITFFTAGPDTVTFPVKVYSMVRFSVTPEVNAASTILIVLTVILTAVGAEAAGQSPAPCDGGSWGRQVVSPSSPSRTSPSASARWWPSTTSR
jgi:spermidine/putrescine transport system permease protein